MLIPEIFRRRPRRFVYRPLYFDPLREERPESYAPGQYIRRRKLAPKKRRPAKGLLWGSAAVIILIIILLSCRTS